MSDLAAFRDHARAMAAKTGHDLAHLASWSCLAARHDGCDLGHDRCPCPCHEPHRTPIPTDTQREQWTQLADEADARLARAHEPALFDP
ncbi:hypothetical protein INN71_02555 [Nocardioides sp. ChNu-153]|uniref:hypothetical protein n=1 Tax=unclassified Nocardioides TaxID=2615069 RepID=UPI0024063116|nr:MULTISPECIES: hypothetical protein [unclassified Nocardioides]MDF9717631.1 hypothetical protein [Nocardioides sp. ChNu-99]MDN7120266.1 hypothetical protein [Nocardioides sp. ChNu-153]